MKIICYLFGHKYRLQKRISNTIREIKCKRCGLEFGMNDDVKTVLPLDNELRKLHKELTIIK
jgi:hypothetical protein